MKSSCELFTHTGEGLDAAARARGRTLEEPLSLHDASQERVWTNIRGKLYYKLYMLVID